MVTADVMDTDENALMSDHEPQDEADNVDGTEGQVLTGPGTKKAGHLDRFWLLANAKTSPLCITASSKVLKYVAENPGETDYSLKRLLRGLASPVETSRNNFFVCLVEFLRQNRQELGNVQPELKQSLRLTGSKGEESVFLLGQILAYVALLRSGTVAEKEERLTVLGELADLGSKRTYLNLIAMSAINEHFVKMDDIESDQLVETVGRCFKLTLDEASLDTLFFILSFLRSRGQSVPSKFLSENFGFKEIEKTSTLERLCQMLTGTMLPMNVILIHPVFPVLASLLVERQCEAKLFVNLVPSMSASSYKGQIGVKLLRECLKADSKRIDNLLTADILGSLRAICMKGLVNPVIEVMDIVEAAVKAESLQTWTVLKRILDCSVSWDKFVPGNTVTFLVSHSEPDSLQKMAELLEQKLKDQTNLSDRLYTLSLLAKLVGHPKMIANLDWRVERLTRLLENTVFLVPSKELGNMNRETTSSLLDTFYRGLDSSCKTLPDSINMVHSVMSKAVALTNQGRKPVKPLDDQAQAAWEKMVATLAKLAKSWEANGTKEAGVFLLLFSHIGLQLFCEAEMAVDVLSELHPVYINWKKSAASKGNPAGIEVVVEIMLSMLAQNKHILRKVVNCIFKVISEQLTEPALQSILKVLLTEEDSQDDSDDDSDGEDEEDEKEEEDSDSEDEEQENEAEELEKDALEKIRKALGDHAEKSESEDSDINMDDIPEEDMEKLDEKLVEAFKALGGKKSNAEKKREKLQHLAQQHFKLRALDLIDIYIQHKPRLNLFFQVVFALLKSFKTVAGQTKDQELSNKIKSSLQKCATCKLECTAAADQDSLSALENLLSLEDDDLSPVIGPLGSMHAKLCMAALRVNISHKSDEAENLYIEALKRFFSELKCPLSCEVFSFAVGIPWHGAIAIAKEASERTFSADTKPYRRSQGLAILSSFLKNQQLEAAFPGQRARIMEGVVTQLMAYLKRDNNRHNPKQLEEVFGILRGVKQQGMIDGQSVAQVQAVLTTFAKSASSTGVLRVQRVKTALKKLLSFYSLKVNLKADAAGADNIISTEPATAVNDNVQKKKKKKKKSKEAAKRTKEEKFKSKDEEDAEVPSFSDFVFDTTQVFKEPDKRKKSKKRKNSENVTVKSQEKKKKSSKT